MLHYGGGHGGFGGLHGRHRRITSSPAHHHHLLYQQQQQHSRSQTAPFIRHPQQHHHHHLHYRKSKRMTMFRERNKKAPRNCPTTSAASVFFSFCFRFILTTRLMDKKTRDFDQVFSFFFASLFLFSLFFYIPKIPLLVGFIVVEP